MIETARLPFRSVKYVLQVSNSITDCLAVKPVADDGKLSEALPEDPRFVKRLMTWVPVEPFRMTMVCESE